MINVVVDGDPQAPVLVLGSSIGTSHRMWNPQLPGMVRDFRVVRFDLPGHGGSGAPEGPCDIADLAATVVKSLEERGITQFAYAGLSMGGAIGQQLALEHPDRLRALVLLCTSASFGQNPQPWRERAARVRSEGMGFLVDGSRARWFVTDAPVPPFGQELLRAQAEVDPAGYAACCEALAGFDSRPWLNQIRVPTRVVAGAQDQATPVSAAQALADGIPGADLVVLPQAAHLANVEQPAAVLQAIREHLRR